MFLSGFQTFRPLFCFFFVLSKSCSSVWNMGYSCEWMIDGCFHTERRGVRKSAKQTRAKESMIKRLICIYTHTNTQEARRKVSSMTLFFASSCFHSSFLVQKILKIHFITPSFLSNHRWRFMQIFFCQSISKHLCYFSVRFHVTFEYQNNKRDQKATTRDIFWETTEVMTHT